MSAERGGGALAIAAAGVLGGAERVLLAWLGAVDVRVTLACPPGALATAAAEGGLAVAPLADRPLALRGRRAAALRDLAALRADVARLARAHRPAVVVASGQRPLLASAWAPLGGAALIALIHDLPPEEPVAAALRAAAARAAAIVATSGAIARAADPVARRIGRTKVIHPGIDPAQWAEIPAPPGGPPRALCLGALVPWKRADLALEIAARVPELRLDLAGAPLPGDPPDFAARLREQGARPDLAGRVRFLGHTDPRAALADAHLLLHCADAEGFGLALVEALAAGRPVVAAAAGGPLEIVTPATARLFSPGDAAAGAAAVRALLAAPPPAAAARARAAQFDGDAAARGFAAVVARHLD